MTHEAAALWHHLPRDLTQRLTLCLEDGLARSRSGRGPVVFFRADDIALAGRQFADMLAVFARHEVPLALAVVPAWMTSLRWKTMKQMTTGDAKLWCWHQHGWRHQNHEPCGKKQEFGPARAAEDIRKDLDRGRRWRPFERIYADSHRPERWVIGACWPFWPSLPGRLPL
jgi:hypothetical protein